MARRVNKQLDHGDELLPRDLRTRIVHLGVGQFSRSHLGVYTHKVLRAGAEDAAGWGICGAGLLPSDQRMRDALESQDHLYTVVTKGSDGKTTADVIGSMTDYIWAGEGALAAARLVARLGHPDTRVVSLTVTEKGYCCDLSTGLLDMSHPAISWLGTSEAAGRLEALVNGSAPLSAMGVLVAGLSEVKRRGGEPFTILSCDNLQGNGSLARKLVLEYASHVDAGVAEWIRDRVSFPNSMVDRITPATTPALISELSEKFGLDDRCPVVAEDFTQWVVEDRFTLGRPEWEKAGALFVDEVLPYELMKLRLLNGSHSALSYLSYLKGHRSVDKAMADPLVRTFLQDYMEEVTPAVPSVPGVDLNAYKQKLLERFSNSQLSDQVARLCEDGSKKLAVFTGPAVSMLLADGVPQDRLQHIAVAVAGWIRYLSDTPLSEIKDPRAEELKQLASGVPSDGAAGFLAATLGPELAGVERWAALVSRAERRLAAEGVDAVLADVSLPVG